MAFDRPDGSMWNTHLCREYSINVHNRIPSAILNTIGMDGDKSENICKIISENLKCSQLEIEYA